MAKHIFIANLFSEECLSKSVVGEKAYNLALLHRNGFRIPEGFVITADGYLAFLQENDIRETIRDHMQNTASRHDSAPDQVSAIMRRNLQDCKLPRSLAEVINGAYNNLGQCSVAIRSSGTAEDLPTASFAGQYDTFLNVNGVESVYEHVKSCFASIWTPRAVAYREKNAIPPDNLRLAVIVQKMVIPEAAGVLFTKNPLSENESEMMIESNYGLGESVVSGQIIPDRYIVGKQGEEHILLSKEIANKTKAVEFAGGGREGVELKQITLEKSEHSSLTDEQILRLASIGASIESLFGCPQDIEWAIDCQGDVHILQSRPITASRRSGHQESGNTLWTRGYSDDYWNDDVTPLFFDLLGDQLTYVVNDELNSIMGYKHMPSELLRLHKAHAYFSVEVLKRKVMNEIPPFIRSDDLLNYFPEGSGPYGKETMRHLPFNIRNRLLAEIRVMLYDPNGGMTKTSSVYSDWTKNVFLPFCEYFDEEMNRLEKSSEGSELMELADNLDKVMMSHFRLVRYGIPVHNIGMNLLANYLLRRFLGEKAAPRIFPILVSGLEHKTNEINWRLNMLGSIARNDESLVALISQTPSKEIHDKLPSLSSASIHAFVDEFDRFVEEYGDRGFTREPYYPRWGEAPEYIFDVLKALVAGEDTDLAQAEETARARRIRAERFVEKQISKQAFGQIKWLLFSTILNMAKTYIVFRENQRFNLDRWITRNRRVFLAIGNRLKEEGYLKNSIDIFFLHRRENRAIMRGTSSMIKGDTSELAAKRHEEFRRYANLTPPKFIEGSREFNDPLPESAHILRGIPASQGIVEGKIRVLNSVSDIQLVRSGDILVVPRTDPGWTPVFSKIAGLITETGGILSHGAVVSREFGIPALTNVRMACQMLKTGQRVVLNGSDGSLEIKE